MWYWSIIVEGPNNRIVGGTEANPGDWGWTVSLQDNTGHFCGATLVNKNNKLFLLTAAHCFRRSFLVLPNNFIAFIGVHSITANEIWVQKIKRTDVELHEYFDPTTFNNDIALIKLKKPNQVNFNAKIVPACMDPIQTFSLENKKAWITGWGSTKYGPFSQPGPIVYKKRQVEITIWTNTECKSKIPNFKNEMMICGGKGSGWFAPSTGACTGDSGGPISYRHSDGKWYVVGVISYTFITCGDNTVFTRVSHYKQWLQNKMN